MKFSVLLFFSFFANSSGYALSESAKNTWDDDFNKIEDRFLFENDEVQQAVLADLKSFDPKIASYLFIAWHEFRYMYLNDGTFNRLLRANIFPVFLQTSYEYITGNELEYSTDNIVRTGVISYEMLALLHELPYLSFDKENVKDFYSLSLKSFFAICTHGSALVGNIYQGMAQSTYDMNLFLTYQILSGFFKGMSALSGFLTTYQAMNFDYMDVALFSLLHSYQKGNEHKKEAVLLKIIASRMEHKGKKS